MKLQKWLKLIDLNPEWNLFCFFGLLQSLWIWLLMKHSQVVNDNNNVKILFLDSDSSVVHSITTRPRPGSPGPESILYIHNIPAFLHDTGMLWKHCIIRVSMRRTFWRTIITYSLVLLCGLMYWHRFSLNSSKSWAAFLILNIMGFMKIRLLLFCDNVSQADKTPHFVIAFVDGFWQCHL